MTNKCNITYKNLPNNYKFMKRVLSIKELSFQTAKLIRFYKQELFWTKYVMLLM